MQLKRVVVTGLGALTPIGNSIQEYWDGLINGKSGAAPITYYDTEKHKTKFACEVKNFNIEDYMDRKESRRLDKFSHYAIASSDEAIKDAGITQDNVNKNRVGVIWGAGIGGLETFQEEVLYYAKGDGTPKFNPFFIPKMIADIAPAHISMRNGFMGPNYTTVSACASSANAMIDAFNYIRLGMCDVIITGGSEAAVTIAGMGGFNSMHALSTRNESPETASRPFDATRDGFIMGEGAAVFVLERLDMAIARGAHIIAEIVGAASNADAHHITAPSPGGVGATRCMQLALEDAGLQASDIKQINAHGTSTPLNDSAEAQAIAAVFGDRSVPVVSIKGVTGHPLGAAGALEAAAVLLSFEKSLIPPTAGTTVIDPEMNIDVVLGEPRSWTPGPTISNNFGFGGHNGSVIISPYKQ
jgi:3-oxoacyl-[acyl-carrier-protein] synthase II